MSARVSSRVFWALTQRRSSSGPRAAPQREHTVGACSASPLTTIGRLPPTAFLAGPFAGRFGGPILVRLAGSLGRGAGSFGLAAALGAIRAPSASPVTSIGVVARRRARTGPGVLARPVGQRARQLMQPPSQVLQFLARHRRQVCPIDILQVRGESGRHARRRILFAPKRKPPTRRSNGRTPGLTTPLQRTGGVNGYPDSFQPGVSGLVLEEKRKRRRFHLGKPMAVDSGTLSGTLERSSLRCRRHGARVSLACQARGSQSTGGITNKF